MKSVTFSFIEGLKKGLRRFKNLPRSEQALTECFNVAPAEQGLEVHEQMVDFGDALAWGGGGKFTGSLDRFVDESNDEFIDSDSDNWVDS